jgi:PAS domain S-box-containing protein
MPIERFENAAPDAGAGIDSCTDFDDRFSEMRRLMDQNSHLQEYLDRIFGISSAIIYILDANGRFIFVNRAVEDVLNFSTEELIGKHFSFILPPDEYERVSREVVLPRIAGRTTGLEEAPKLFNERRRGARRTRNMEVRLMARRPDDYRIIAGGVTGIVEVEGAYSIVEDQESADGKKEVFLGSQGVIFDITKYKKAELERLELHKRLFRIQKMDAIGKLSGRVAHDLNNKLGSIIATAEILKQGLRDIDPETLDIYLDTILTASKNAAELSNQLSEFSRKGESSFERLDFHKLLTGVMGFVESIAGSNISIHKIMLSKYPAVTGSETMLQNAILNLVVNAFEAMRGGGVLTIETSDAAIEAPLRTASRCTLNPGEYLLVSVRDTGVGMDEEVKKKLFDPFFTTDAEKGIGLGLTSIRECIRNHGGVINMESDPGKGSRFDIYLPRAGE